MEAPLFIDGKKTGSLHMTQDGLYTVLEANVDGEGERLVRLWAHGEGRSAYLGLMQPWSGGLWLRRKFSALEWRRLPNPIEYVSDTEGENRGRENEVDLHNNSNKMYVEHENEENKDLHNITVEPEADMGKDKGGLHNTETDAHACPWPAEPRAEGLLWYTRGDGSLVAFDGVSSLLALPAELRVPSARAAERVIEGKKYLVFRY